MGALKESLTTELGYGLNEKIENLVPVEPKTNNVISLTRHTRNENILWWSTLTDIQKEGLLNGALIKFPYLRNQMELGGVTILDEKFVKNFSFGTLMSILNREEVRNYDRN
jgi:hypothetical protein